MAGRAGRRGLTFGTVILLTDLLPEFNKNEIVKMMTGQLQRIQSKFSFNYNLS